MVLNWHVVGRLTTIKIERKYVPFVLTVYQAHSHCFIINTVALARHCLSCKHCQCFMNKDMDFYQC